MAKIILTESDLRNVIKKTINKYIIKEGYHRGQGQFFVKGMLSKPSDLTNLETTKHWDDRSERTNVIYQKVKDAGDPIYSFIVDTGHPHGDEIHTITEKAMIIIQNKNTKKVITLLAARPGQITRYWKLLNMPLPTNDITFKLILRFANNNEDRELNLA